MTFEILTMVRNEKSRRRQKAAVTKRVRDGLLSRLACFSKTYSAADPLHLLAQGSPRAIAAGAFK
jgi:hypothetical protein